MDNSISALLGIPKSVCDWDYLDTSFPPIQTPSFMRDFPLNDPMRNLIMRSMPKMDYHWRKGREIPVRAKEKGIGKFKNRTWEWINKKYALETSRLVVSWDESFPFCQTDLGSGFWLQSGPMAPDTLRTDTNRAFYLCFLYQKQGYVNRADGTKRLAKFIQYLSAMPKCPYQAVYLRPTGEEMLSKYSPHLQALKYKHTNHSTEQLKKIYGRILKAKRTKERDPIGGMYWRTDLFQPTDPKEHKTKFPWPKLLASA